MLCFRTLTFPFPTASILQINFGHGPGKIKILFSQNFLIAFVLINKKTNKKSPPLAPHSGLDQTRITPTPPFNTSHVATCASHEVKVWTISETRDRDKRVGDLVMEPISQRIPPRTFSGQLSGRWVERGHFD
jgi:hypothetical protein